MYVILVYDVVTDEQGRKSLPKIFKICKKYLTHIQNSVFEGELSKPNEVKLKNELQRYIRKDTDSVILFRTREKRWMAKEFWGLKDDKTSNFL
jgi:CRISPR-associated protein Cas2